MGIRGVVSKVYSYIPHFEIIKEYPKGTSEVFTIPKRTFHGENTVTAENGRAFLGPIP